MSTMSSVAWRRLAGVAALAAALGTGCRNDCQRLCQEMADFAEEDCGKEFPKEQVKECMAAYPNAEVDEDQEAVCADITPTLREEWTCEEINEYFDAGGGGGGGGGSDTGA